MLDSIQLQCCKYRSQLEACVRNPGLLEIYGLYTVEAFHAENVRFLEDCATLFNLARADLTEELMRSIALKSREIVEKVDPSFPVTTKAKPHITRSVLITVYHH